MDAHRVQVPAAIRSSTGARSAATTGTARTGHARPRGVVFYKWNNLQDEPPEHSTNLLRSWEKVQPGTVGETLLKFACGIRHVTPVIPELKTTGSTFTLV